MSKQHSEAGRKGGHATAKKYPGAASARGKITKARRDAGLPPRKCKKR